jgi:hypothetical protein
LYPKYKIQPTNSYIHPFFANTDLSVLPQLIQRFVIHITSNKDDLKTNPPPHKRNKFPPSTQPHCTILFHSRTGVTKRRAATQSKPLQIPEYDAVRRCRLGCTSNVTLGDVELLEVREEGVRGGGGHNGMKKRRRNPSRSSASVTILQPQALDRLQRPK